MGTATYHPFSITAIIHLCVHSKVDYNNAMLIQTMIYTIFPLTFVNIMETKLPGDTVTHGMTWLFVLFVPNNSTC